MYFSYNHLDFAIFLATCDNVLVRMQKSLESKLVRLIGL